MALFGKKKRERSVYFPWERRGISALAPGRRARAWFFLGLMVLAVLALRRRERHERDVRITRATLRHVQSAIDAFTADHDGRCPRDLGELTNREVRRVYLASVPTDAWKHPLRYACPGRADHPYDLLSDGPDGEPFGLDRIESIE